MDANTKDALVNRFQQGLATAEDLQQLEALIADGQLTPEELSSLNTLQDDLNHSPDPTPSSALDHRFYAMLAQEKRAQEARETSNVRLMPAWTLRIAAAVALVVAGAVGGYWWRGTSTPDNMQALTREISDLREMVMFSMLEKESASERLKAVSLTSGMDQVSSKVTSALIKTLNEDANVNVRLAALEALKPYTGSESIRMALVHSIRTQQSPLVQVALAELMAALQEKNSVGPLRKLMESDSTPKEVKGKIQESINILI